jgi:hypothetical protein
MTDKSMRILLISELIGTFTPSFADGLCERGTREQNPQKDLVSITVSLFVVVKS